MKEWAKMAEIVLFFALWAWVISSFVQVLANCA
jgi:hypothetical protein